MKEQNSRESRFYIGMEVPILEHKTSSSQSCISFKGKVVSIKDNIPYTIICLNSQCASTSVMLDFNTFFLQQE